MNNTSYGEYQATILKIEALNYDTKKIILQLNDEMDFKPGHFVALEFVDTTLYPEIVFRGYSIASSPSKSKEITLIIRKVPRGLMTTFVHDHFKEGDHVNITGPHGEFHLDLSLSRDILCVSGGSGIAPIISILDYLAEQRFQKQVFFFHGAVQRKDLYLLDYIQNYKQPIVHFEFTPVLSGPSEACQWTGETGFVHQVVEKKMPQGCDMDVYVCGNPKMSLALEESLRKKQFNMEHVYIDAYQ